MKILPVIGHSIAILILIGRDHSNLTSIGQRDNFSMIVDLCVVDTIPGEKLPKEQPDTVVKNER